MKPAFYFVLVINLLFYSCKNKPSNNYASIRPLKLSDSLTEKTNKKQQRSEKKEDFTVFLGDFSTDIEIQRKKIADNAMDYIVTDGSNKKDSAIIKIGKKKWTFIKLVNDNTLYNISNNFNKEIFDTDQRVFVMDSAEGNGASYFYFKRNRGKWYLVKRVVYLTNKPSQINSDFEGFLKYFSSDINSQQSRISDDALDCDVSNEGDSTCEKVDKVKWHLIKLADENTFNFIYNDFSIKMNSSNERVFSIISIEGPGSYYYFKRKNLKWFLVKIVNYGD